MCPPFFPRRALEVCGRALAFLFLCVTRDTLDVQRPHAPVLLHSVHCSSVLAISPGRHVNLQAPTPSPAAAGAPNPLISPGDVGGHQLPARCHLQAMRGDLPHPALRCVPPSPTPFMHPGSPQCACLPGSSSRRFNQCLLDPCAWDGDHGSIHCAVASSLFWQGPTFGAMGPVTHSKTPAADGPAGLCKAEGPQSTYCLVLHTVMFTLPLCVGSIVCRM